MDVDEALGDWIQQQKRKKLRFPKISSQNIVCNTGVYKVLSQSDFKEHIENKHVTVRVNECSKSGRTFEENSDPRGHASNHIGDNINNELKCNKCDRVYGNMSTLRRHDWRSHRPIDCNICGVKLESRQDISEHRKVEHKMFKRIKCRFYPNCIDQDECFFIHEESVPVQETRYRSHGYCPDGLECHNQSCEYSDNNHKNFKEILCRFQARCNRAECEFKHVVDRTAFLALCAKNYERK